MSHPFDVAAVEQARVFAGVSEGMAVQNAAVALFRGSTAGGDLVSAVEAAADELEELSAESLWVLAAAAAVLGRVASGLAVSRFPRSA